jgi:hypothetical protein
MIREPFDGPGNHGRGETKRLDTDPLIVAVEHPEKVVEVDFIIE